MPEQPIQVFGKNQTNYGITTCASEWHQNSGSGSMFEKSKADLVSELILLSKQIDRKPRVRMNIGGMLGHLHWLVSRIPVRRNCWHLSKRARLMLPKRLNLHQHSWCLPQQHLARSYTCSNWERSSSWHVVNSFAHKIPEPIWISHWIKVATLERRKKHTCNPTTSAIPFPSLNIMTC